MRKTIAQASKHSYAAPLSPRAAIRRVFGGMAVFVSCPLLGLGAYLIKNQFDDPVGSHPAGLLFAALLIAAAIVLLSYVIYPGRPRALEANAELQDEQEEQRTIEISPLVVRESRADLRVHTTRYNDAARIRL
jgi:hypothetical protein